MVEEALGKIESVAAPLIQGLENGAYPARERRAELALFLAMSWLRTPAWGYAGRTKYKISTTSRMMTRIPIRP